MSERIDETPVRRIEKGLAARYPLIYVLCREEERLEALLGRLAAAHYGEARPVQVWTSTEGFVLTSGAVDGTRDPLDALRRIAAADRDGFYLLKDLPALFDDSNLVRGLRNLYRQLADRNSFVFLSHPQLRIPEPLSHQIFLVELGLPTEREIHEQFGLDIHAPATRQALRILAENINYMVEELQKRIAALQEEKAKVEAAFADLERVAWDGERFVAVGEGGTILASADSVNWGPDLSASTADLYGVAAGDEGLVPRSPERRLAGRRGPHRQRRPRSDVDR